MWTSEQLDKKRQQGDAKADELINTVFAQNGMVGIKNLMSFLTNAYLWDITTQPKEVQKFFKSISCSINQKQLNKALSFYQENQQNIGLVLACYSLPYCYLGEDGARVLYLSEKIRNNTFKRLLDTGDFLNGIFKASDWENEKVFVRIGKIRLIHAASRFFCLQQTEWNMSWGMPVNQEDMAGTNLAFSMIVLRGLQKMGIRVDTSKTEAFLYFWRVVGSILGIDDDLLVNTFKEASKLDKLIAKRQFRPSVIGKELTESLRSTIEERQPNPLLKGLPTAQMRFFLGDEYADFLAIPHNKITQNIVALSTNLRTIFS